ARHHDPEVLRVHRLAELAGTTVEYLNVDPGVLHHRLERLRDRGFGRVVTEGGQLDRERLPGRVGGDSPWFAGPPGRRQRLSRAFWVGILHRVVVLIARIEGHQQPRTGHLLVPVEAL